jgi:hypothetical protein
MQEQMVIITSLKYWLSLNTYKLLEKERKQILHLHKGRNSNKTRAINIYIAILKNKNYF